MGIDKKDRFYWRAFVTFYIVLSFLVIAASGLVLYISPPGRVANWSQWSLGGLTKANWQAVHTVFTFLFVVAAAVHIYFNWRVILAYVKSKVGAGVRRGRELTLASGVAAAVLTLTIVGMPPFSSVMSYGESVKNSWSNPSTEPPVPHAELWTVAKFAESTKVPVESAMRNLADGGMSIDSADVTLQAIASRYGVTPQEVYAKAVGTAKSVPVALAEGGGYGQKSVQQIAEQLDIPLTTALDRLHRAGIRQAAADSNLRELATANSRRPFEIAQIIQGNGS
ncbi:MAG: DUF4405 domain-containing protein [Acidobacteria bacterium]|nr:MAG: DUF4405 domain-containing protein [Acidobacteriota bacterium]